MKFKIFPWVAFVAAVSANHAIAQTPQPAASPSPSTTTDLALVYGQMRLGELTPADRSNTRALLRYKTYDLALEAGQNVQIDASSQTFSPVLELKDPEGNWVVTKGDDAFGPDTRIRYQASRSGVYKVSVSAFAWDTLGAYSISAGPPTPRPTVPPPQPLALGVPLIGTISRDTPISERNGEDVRVARFAFDAKASALYRITTTTRAGSDFDPVIFVGKLVDGVIVAPVIDDDSGGHSNASMRFRAPTAGAFAIDVMSIFKRTGSFDIKVEQAPSDGPPAAPIAVILGQEFKGVLADGGARDDDDILYASYSVSLRSGEAITITMKKDGDSPIDPKIRIGRGSRASFALLAEDDNGGLGLEARLRFVAPAAGTYIIRATAFGPNFTGGYIF